MQDLHRQCQSKGILNSGFIMPQVKVSKEQTHPISKLKHQMVSDLSQISLKKRKFIHPVQQKQVLLVRKSFNVKL